jgi:predicted ATPase
LIKLNQLIIGNFKSLDEFELNFSDFTCLIGLNSSGKSTILQAIDFISAQMDGNITQWLKDRDWESGELTSKLANNIFKDIHITIGFFYNDIFYIWNFLFDTKLNRCVKEEIYLLKDEKYENREIIFLNEDSKYMIIKDLETKEKSEGDIIFDYEGSLLANLKDELLPEPIREFKKYLKNIHSLDLLSPKELRKDSNINETLNLNGANISSFLNKFDNEQKENLLIQLKKCYKNLDNYNIKIDDDLAQIEVIENFNGKKITHKGKYLNDGILRLIAILAQLQSEKSFLLFDEIENGINSELIEFLLDTLIASKHQVMITTHSPMVLNYIEDDVAIKSVQYIYKNKDGFTKSIPFFDIPSMKEKLEYMGAGEVYVDTNLADLENEIIAIEIEKEKSKEVK